MNNELFEKVFEKLDDIQKCSTKTQIKVVKIEEHLKTLVSL